MNFTSATPFTTFQLAGFSGPNTGAIFAIDNLFLEVVAAPAVPEPSTTGLVAIGLGTLGTAFARRRRTLNGQAKIN